MSKFVVVYQGGQMGDSPADQEAVMNKWMAWFGSLGSSVTDMGNPFGSSSAVRPDGSHAPTTAGLSGYTILEAESLDHALAAVKDCPHLSYDGTIEVYEAMAM